jgi:hypothetical protein
MRHYRQPILILAACCLTLVAAAPAISQEPVKSCKTMSRATVWSVDAQQAYLVLVDEGGRQFVVSCEDVRRRRSPSKALGRIQVGDAVTVKCHALR